MTCAIDRPPTMPQKDEATFEDNESVSPGASSRPPELSLLPKISKNQPTWFICPPARPNLLLDDWHCGYQDCFNSRPLRYPENTEYARGWKYADAMKDGYADVEDFQKLYTEARALTILTADVEYFEAYILGYRAKYFNPEIPQRRRRRKSDARLANSTAQY